MNLLDLFPNNENSTPTETINHNETSIPISTDNHLVPKDTVAEFLVRLSSTPVENQYILNFVFKEYQKSQEKVTLESLKGQFDVTIDKKNNTLILTESDNSIILDKDMLFSCLSAIKVQKKHSIK